MKMTGLVYERRAVEMFCLDFSRLSDTISNKILIDKLRRYWLDG